MNWVEIITPIATALFGALSTGSILYIKQNRKDKEAETTGKLVKQWEDLCTTKDEVIKSLNDELIRVKEAYEVLRQREAEGRQRGTEDKVSLIKDNAKLQMENQHLCFWRCNVRGCVNRIPPQEIDVLEQKD